MITIIFDNIFLGKNITFIPNIFSTYDNYCQVKIFFNLYFIINYYYYNLIRFIKRNNIN